MTMAATEKRMLDREALRSVIQQWNANRLDLFELSEPDENLQFHGVMRFYFQDAGQKVATKCIRVASDATVADVIETLIEKFRPDMRMLSLPNYALYEVHSNHEERKLNPDEKPLLVQLNWHIDDREGRFLLKNIDQKTHTLETTDTIFKRKLSKREKKEQKKKDKLAKIQSNNNENHVAEKLYTELPETSFTRSISNPEAVMRRRRQQKLEKKLQQFRSRDGGPDTGGTLKIYGESLCRDVPYKTLLLSIRDCAQAVVREMLAKYGLDKADPLHYCLVQVNSDATEYILDDDECPLSILMNHPTSRGSIMFHVRRRPADSQPRRRKKKPLGSNGSNSVSGDRDGPTLLEILHSGDGGRRMKLGSEPIEVGSANTNALQLFGPSIQARHCLISLLDSVCTVTPLHADALTFVNGHQIQQPTILHNGSVVIFGRVASFRFIDPPTDGRYNLALSQSQLDSACLYESRSPTSPSWHEDDRPLSPVHSVAQAQTQNNPKSSYLESSDISNRSSQVVEQQTSGKQPQFDMHHHHHHPQSIQNNNQTGSIVDTESIVDDCKSVVSQQEERKKDNQFEVPYDIETETKSISSIKSAGSNQELRSNKMQPTSEPGQEAILPAVLEFPETHQELFLRHVISDLDVKAPNFKLAPVYTLYLCARYRASTHYRPDLQPTERAHKLTMFLHHVANLIHNVVQDQYTDPKILSFWMANSSEFLHFLKSDRHISAFSIQAQEVLAESVQKAFRNLVSCFHAELSQTLSQFMSENIDHESAAGLVLTVLGSAMALLRRCRVNAPLTIQLFSQLFHYINVVCFNKIVTTTYMCTAEWGKLLTDRLQLLELWAERQGLELAADCHLAKINQCAQFLQAPKSNISEVQQLACSCFRLNSLQMGALLSQEQLPRNLVDTAVRMAESVADELTRSDGREVRLEESPELPLALLLPDDGFSCDVVRGIPAGLVDFVSTLQANGMCRLAAQPTSIGLWTVYMHQYNVRPPSSMSTKLPQPEVQMIKLHKNSNGMGLSIVAAKGAGRERLGIYIKSVVPGGAADLDRRLQAGDQLLSVDGQSLIGITQERAADYLVRTGTVVSLEVAKQGAIYDGLATLLQQPSPIIQRGTRRMSERDISRIGIDTKPPLPSPGSQLLNSKSTPALHNVGNIAMSGNKSRSIHNLVANNNDQGFYQNLSIYRAQNQSQPNLGERSHNMSMQSTITSPTPSSTTIPNNQQMLSRPTSAYFNSNNSNSLPSQNSMSYTMQPPTINNNNGNMSHQTLTNNRPKNNFVRDQQGQQSLRINQMMAPSMPNIAHSSGYATNISASQSMQNVNMNYHPSNNNLLMSPPLTTTANPHQQQMAYQQDLQQQQNQASLMRGQAKLAEMGEVLKRRHQRQQAQDMMTNSLDNIPGQNGMMMPPPPGGISPMMLSPTGQTNGHPQTKPPLPGPIQYSSQHGMNYPQQVKQLPPTTAPKPRPVQHEQTPPLPPTATHPLYKTPGNVANSNPNVNMVGNYPNQSGSSKNVSGPWEREEREREQEIRREQVRQWRELQISDLSNISHRTQQQEEQLRTIVLERDFDKRALEEEQEDDNDSSYPKENIQEMIRLNPSNQIAPPLTSMKQVDIKLTTQSTTIPLVDSTFDFSQNVSAPTVQPKSILKHHNAPRVDNAPNSNPTSPSKQQKTASFADEQQQNSATPMINQVMKEMGGLNLANEFDAVANDEYFQRQQQLLFDTQQQQQQQQQLQQQLLLQQQQQQMMNNLPPPPPERNSSYVIMSQQQQKLRNSTVPSINESVAPVNKRLSANNNNLHNIPQATNHISTTNASMFANRDGNRRVSFHDEENNLIVGSAILGDQAELQVIREDIRYLEETQSIMDSPMSPDMNDTSWNSNIQSTPGVIGAQEVYRDPRQRRLQEKQQQQQQKTAGDTVPEKLSFKEKMKMFALESGEDQTPKDKLKISRAQRDIDNVH